MATRNSWAGLGWLVGSVILARKIGEERHWDRGAYWICALFAAPFIASGIWVAVSLYRDNKEFNRQLKTGEMFDPEKFAPHGKSYEEWKAKQNK